MTRKLRLITTAKSVDYTPTYLMRAFLRGETREEETDLCIFFRALIGDNSQPASRIHSSMLKMKIKEFTQRRKEHVPET